MGRGLVATSYKRQIVSSVAQVPRDPQLGDNLDIHKGLQSFNQFGSPATRAHSAMLHLASS